MRREEQAPERSREVGQGMREEQAPPLPGNFESVADFERRKEQALPYQNSKKGYIPFLILSLGSS